MATIHCEGAINRGGPLFKVVCHGLLYTMKGAINRGGSLFKTHSDDDPIGY